MLNADINKIDKNKIEPYIKEFYSSFKEKSKNIALMGPYGSGKSTILNQLKNLSNDEFNKVEIKNIEKEIKIKQRLKKDEKNIVKEIESLKEYKQILKNKHIVNINMMEFSNLNSNELIDDSNNKENKDNNTFKKISSNLESKSYNEKIDKIERSIIKQLIYSEKDKQIPYSNIKKEKPSRLKLIFNITFFILFLIIVSTFLVLILNKINKWYTWVSLTIALFLLGFLIYIIANYFIRNYKISKISLAKVEANIEYNKYENAYNYFLDEIIYFFKKTKYNVVVFEDIDRYNDVLLFSHLRELNSILNNSKYLNKHITFIYAVREEIFENNDKHKFFDYIIPVIPIVDYTNSFDKFNEFLNNDIDEYNLKLLSNFVGDLRVIKNIIKEYKFYSKSPSTIKYDKNKLFSIIFLKNLFPDEFVNMQYNRSVMEEIISIKQNTLREWKIKLENEINKYKKMLNCDDLYLDPIYSILGLLKDLILKQYNIKPDLWISIKEFNQSGFLFREWFNINLDLTILRELKQITINHNTNEYPINIDELTKEKINKLIKLKNDREKYPILIRSELLKKHDELDDKLMNLENISLSSFFNENLDVLENTLENYFKYHTNKNRIKSLFRALILNDLLKENYSKYISLNYKDKTNESIFIENLNLKIENDFDLEFENIEEVVVELGDSLFNNTFVFNYSVIKYLLKHNPNNLKKLLKINIQKIPILYKKLEPQNVDSKKIFEIILEIDYFNVLNYISNDDNEYRRNYLIKLFLISKKRMLNNENIGNELIKLIENYNLINLLKIDNNEIENFIYNFKNHNILISNIHGSADNNNLFLAIINNSIFQFNYENLSFINVDLDYQYFSRNHNLKLYINQNINIFISILIDKNIETNQSDEFHELINKDDDLELTKKYYENIKIDVNNPIIFVNDEIKIILSKNNTNNLFKFLDDNNTTNELKIKLFNLLKTKDILNNIITIYRIITKYRIYNILLFDIYKLIFENLENQNDKDLLMGNILDIFDNKKLKLILKSYNSEFRKNKKDIIIEKNPQTEKIFNKIKEINLYELTIENNFYIIKLKNNK